jgi:hypothetical protein
VGRGRVTREGDGEKERVKEAMNMNTLYACMEAS